MKHGNFKHLRINKIRSLTTTEVTKVAGGMSVTCGTVFQSNCGCEPTHTQWFGGCSYPTQGPC